MAKTYFEQLFSDKENERIYQQESLIVELTEAIYELIESKKMKKKDLAEKLTVSQSQITQFLDGSANMRLRTISDILFVLDSKLKVEIEPLVKNFEPDHYLCSSQNQWHNEEPISDSRRGGQNKREAA
jgi:transcriptional regulator with XRE-family HTH domain